MTKEYQGQLAQRLHETFNDLPLKPEWNAFEGPLYHFQYSPRVDIAIGPFSTQPGENQIEYYNRLIERNNITTFLTRVYQFHCENMDIIHYDEIVLPDFDEILFCNLNARCFLAFEIENNNSRKHTLGSIVNSSALGRIGIGVAYSDRAFNMFRRIINYLYFLRRVEKNTFDTRNFLVIRPNQLNELLFCP